MYVLYCTVQSQPPGQPPLELSWRRRLATPTRKRPFPPSPLPAGPPLPSPPTMMAEEGRKGRAVTVGWLTAPAEWRWVDRRVAPARARSPCCGAHTYSPRPNVMDGWRGGDPSKLAAGGDRGTRVARIGNPDQTRNFPKPSILGDGRRGPLPTWAMRLWHTRTTRGARARAWALEVVGEAAGVAKRPA